MVKGHGYHFYNRKTNVVIGNITLLPVIILFTSGSRPQHRAIRPLHSQKTEEEKTRATQAQGGYRLIRSELKAKDIKDRKRDWAIQEAETLKTRSLLKILVSPLLGNRVFLSTRTSFFERIVVDVFRVFGKCIDLFYPQCETPCLESGSFSRVFSQSR